MLLNLPAIKNAEPRDRVYKLFDEKVLFLLMTLSLDDELLSQKAVVRRWLEEMSVDVLNTAGPSEKTCAGIHAAAYQRISDLLSYLSKRI